MTDDTREWKLKARRHEITVKMDQLGKENEELAITLRILQRYAIPETSGKDMSDKGLCPAVNKTEAP